MAAKNKTVTSKFYQFRDGKIIRRVPTENENTKVFKPENGKEFFAEVYTNLVSTLKGLTITTEEYKQIEYTVLNVKLFDGKDHEQIQCRFESNEAASIITRLSSMAEADINNEIEIGCMKDKNGYNLVFIRQNGQTVKSPYSKENPLPAWGKHEIGKGKNTQIVWDKTDYLKVLENLVEQINEKVKFSKTVPIENPLNSVDDLSTEAQPTSEEVTDDLPF
jgi:hypothetical protein